MHAAPVCNRYEARARLVFVLLGLILGTGTASAATSDARAPVETYAPGEVLGTLFGQMPEWQWSANGNLIYTVGKSRKPQTFAFDPGSGSLMPGKAEAGPNAASAKPRILAPGIFSYSPPIREVASPDGKWFAGMRDGNLYLRPAGKGTTHVLTRDGTSANGYTVLGARWSPDGHYLAVHRMDARGVPTIPLVDWAEAAQPAKRWPYSRAGDPLVRQTLVLADTRSGKTEDIGLDDSLAYLHPVSWSRDSRYLYLMATTRLMKRIALIRIDAASGKARTLLTESARTNIDGSQSYLFVRGYAPQLTNLHYVTMLPDGGFVWTSERDGWRRLYLYSADGKLLRPLTPTQQPVVRVVGLDAAHDMIYYVGQAKRSRPYENALFAVNLAGGAPREVVFGPRFFRISLRADGKYVAAVHGGLDAAPALDVYDSNGKSVRRIWSAAQVLARFATQPPEAVVAKAADGQTLLYGMVFKPRGFNPDRKYPVVEIIYAGPQEGIVAHWQAGPNYWVGESLASSGFVAVEVDARGTPGRGRAFANAFHGRIGEGEIADHVAALREIAAKRPWMDMSRVGVTGHSWGGYFAARALLQAPDLYKAAAASAGPASLRDFRVPIEPYMGCLPGQCPKAYDEGSNLALVPHMQGKLMILQGTADRDVPFAESMRLIAALEKAGKNYQYVAFPGQPHTIYYSAYWWHRIVDFFEQTLGGDGGN
jgi:dipeptidyl aminopeptidase/acylaminoacyl peptidase